MLAFFVDKLALIKIIVVYGAGCVKQKCGDYCPEVFGTRTESILLDRFLAHNRIKYRIRRPQFDINRSRCLFDLDTVLTAP